MIITMEISQKDGKSCSYFKACWSEALFGLNGIPVFQSKGTQLYIYIFQTKLKLLSYSEAVTIILMNSDLIDGVEVRFQPLKVGIWRKGCDEMKLI